MLKLRTLCFVLCLNGLLGCGSPDLEYAIEGVPIILSLAEGPTQKRMELATEFYRAQAVHQFGISVEWEKRLWRLLKGIWWIRPTGYVVRNYIPQDGSITLQWQGCVVRSALYAALTQHYIWELKRHTRYLIDDYLWAAELTKQASIVFCVDR